MNLLLQIYMQLVPLFPICCQCIIFSKMCYRTVLTVLFVCFSSKEANVIGADWGTPRQRRLRGIGEGELMM